MKGTINPISKLFTQIRELGELNENASENIIPDFIRVVLSSCGVVQKAKESKMNDTDLANAMKQYDDICRRVITNWLSTVLCVRHLDLIGRSVPVMILSGIILNH